MGFEDFAGFGTVPSGKSPAANAAGLFLALYFYCSWFGEIVGHGGKQRSAVQSRHKATQRPSDLFGERDGPEPGLPSEVRPDARIVTEISQFCHKLVSLRLFATAQGLLNGSPANYLHAAGEVDPAKTCRERS